MIPVNKEEAIKYIKMAIEKGNCTAMISYAYMLRVGDHIPINNEEAIKYYKMAIDKGNSSAIKSCADILRYGRGDSDAMNIYAVMCFNGKNVPVNKEEGFKYLKMAVDRGNINAIINYAAFLSINGKSSSDQEESTKYFKLL